MLKTFFKKPLAVVLTLLIVISSITAGVYAITVDDHGEFTVITKFYRNGEEVTEVCPGDEIEARMSFKSEVTLDADPDDGESDEYPVYFAQLVLNWNKAVLELDESGATYVNGAMTFASNIGTISYVPYTKGTVGDTQAVLMYTGFLGEDNDPQGIVFDPATTGKDVMIWKFTVKEDAALESTSIFSVDQATVNTLPSNTSTKDFQSIITSADTQGLLDPDLYYVTITPASDTLTVAHDPADPVKENEVEATCQEHGTYESVVYCKNCNAEISRDPMTTDQANHTPGDTVTENEVAATCKDEGSYDEVVYCTECNEELSRVPKTIEKLAHTPEEDAAVAPTCTEAGKTAGSHCSVCDEVIVAQETVAALGHTTPTAAVTENEVKPDCTNPGSHDEVLYCTVCGEQIDRTNVTDDPLGHTAGAPVKENATSGDCTTPGAYDMVTYCTVCGEELDTQHFEDTVPGHTEGTPVEENRIEATCKDEGSYDEVVYCSVCGEELSRVPKTIEKLAHTPEEDAAVAPTCTEAGKTAGSHCSVCGAVITAQEDVAALGHTIVVDEAVAPTCTETGLTEGSHCSVCNEVLVAQETVGALGHTEETVEGKEATCTEAGYSEAVKCSVCGEVLSASDVIPAKGHTEETVAGYEATCTEKGLSDGKKCSVCGETTVEQEEIAALGHEYGEEVEVERVDATDTEEGYVKYEQKCIRFDACGEKKERTEVLPIATYTDTYYVASGVDANGKITYAKLQDVELKKSETYEAPDGLDSSVADKIEFLGWATAKDAEEADIVAKAGDTMTMADGAEYYAVYKLVEYTITYTVDGETILEKEVAYGSEVPQPEDPTKEGLKFAGWDIDGDGEADEIPATMPVGGFTATAVFTSAERMVTYMKQNTLGQYVYFTSFEDVAVGSDIPTPDEEPYRLGYKFTGWEDEDGCTPADITMPDEDIVFKAQYEVDKTFVAVTIGGVVVGGAVAGGVFAANAAAITAAAIVGGVVIVGAAAIIAGKDKDNDNCPGKDDKPADVDDEIPNTGSATISFAALGVISSAAAAAYVLSIRKKKNED